MKPTDHKPTIYLAPIRILLREERMTTIETEYMVE